MRAKKPEVTEKIQKAKIVKANLKYPIKYDIELNEEQKNVKRLIYDNRITVITGKAGTGKSLVAIQVALDMYFKKETGKIFITRPIQETGQSMGYLPGTMEDKIAPYLIPIIDNLEKVYNPDKIKEMLEEKKIDIAPINFVRGRTFDDVLIIDEAQNARLSDLMACLTRLGKKGRIIITGDVAQIDLKNKKSSGLAYVIKMAQAIGGMGYADLKENHRDGLVKEILDYMEANPEEEEKEETKRYLRG